MTSTRELVVSPTTENVQVRVIREIPAPAPDPLVDDVRGLHAVSEFVLGRQRLFSGRSGGLRAVRHEDRDLVTGFSTHGIDPFEIAESGHGPPPAQRYGIPEPLVLGSPVSRMQRSPIARCSACHNQPGVYSFNTFVNNPGRLTSRSARDVLADGLRWKQGRADWMLLRALLDEPLVRAH
ncbi:MAG: hypothetical protein H0X67_08925 [Acidobacteria bacterium]|nr:hypothetical protein [Acidobacteriota bacterium]